MADDILSNPKARRDFHILQTFEAGIVLHGTESDTALYTIPAPYMSDAKPDKNSPYGVEQAIDVTQIGRFYERFADHAVSVAHRVVYLVTGQYPEPAATESV
jgi:hypothetical protein